MGITQWTTKLCEILPIIYCSCFVIEKWDMENLSLYSGKNTYEQHKLRMLCLKTWSWLGPTELDIWQLTQTGCSFLGAAFRWALKKMCLLLTCERGMEKRWLEKHLRIWTMWTPHSPLRISHFYSQENLEIPTYLFYKVN